MSFRNLSLIFITLLLTSVLLLQWWSITRFAQDVSRQVGESAFEVSRATAETLLFDQPEIEFHSFSLSPSDSQFSEKPLKKVLTRIHHDVVIQLHDKQEDDFILFNADGSDYQIPIPRTGIHDALENFSNNVLYATLTLLLVGITLAIYFTHKIATPLKNLQTASTRLGEGNLGTQIEKDNKWHSREIEMTIDSFNQMSTKIQVLQKQNELLQGKVHLAELSEITRGLAHTIRNPLNTLNLAIDQIQSSDNQQQREELSKLAKYQVIRIDKWIRSLMDVMSDDINLISTVDLVSIVIEVIQDLSLSGNRDAKIIFDEPTENYLISAVNSELKSILQSLIVNALEASPANTNVRISMHNSNNGVRITIKDQGKGFSQKVLDKLFTPHNTDKTYGSGMGLYLAHRIIKHKYHGDITIENNSDIGSIATGSTVTITINNRDDQLESKLRLEN